jgi:UPF0716 protein FxsA
MRLLLAFIAVPLIEIGLFIQVGDYIGLWPTLTIVLLTAIIGTSLVRSQGIRAIAKLQDSFLTMQNPVEPLAHGAMILFAGALLLTPGFFTDFIGVLLLFPQFRSFVMRQLRSRIKMNKFNFNKSEKHHADDVIDGSFNDVTPRDNPSGWTKD